MMATPGADQNLIVCAPSRFSSNSAFLSPEVLTLLNRIVGSCNGLVCVSVFNKWYHRDNPDTYPLESCSKQSKLIPPHNLHDQIMSAAIGFGFDPIASDYKVVRIVHFMSDKPKPRATEVYSANTDVWLEVKPDFSKDGNSFINVPEDFPEDDRFDVCVNGLLCCLGYYVMMAFDLSMEVFTINIGLPVGCSDACFTNFNDTIAVITSQQHKRNHTLWTLDDEACLRGGGVKASWTVMLTVDVDFPVWRVCGCFNSGDFVLYTEDGASILYNSHKKEARDAPVSINVGIYHQIIKYNESLVSITGSKQVDWNAHEDRKSGTIRNQH